MKSRPRRRLLTIQKDRVDRGLAMIFCRKEKSSITDIREPDEACDGPIELFGQVARLSRLSILHEEPPLIGFKAGARLRQPGDVFPIRRIERRRIAAGTGGNFLSGSCRTGYRHDEDL